MRATTTTTVAIATAAEVPDLDAEGQLLMEVLRAAGASAAPAVWDNTAVDWSAFDVVVVRSTWDYAARRGQFLSWAQHVSTATLLLNAASLLEWTTDKRYLLDLQRAGVPVVTSWFLEPGDSTEHPYLAQEHVVKPTVSAGSKDTLRLSASEAARSRDHADRLLSEGRGVLVQPYLSEVDTAGETALVFIDGHYSHATRKAAILELDGALVDGLFAPEDLSPTTATADEIAVGRQALSAAAERTAIPPLYARVDLLPTSAGPQVLELELAEPSLFLDQHDGAADRLADALLRRVR